MLNYSEFVKEQKEYNPGIGEEFWNAGDWFSMGRVVVNRKWIKKIKYIFYSIIHTNKGVIINEEDPYGEEQWGDDIGDDQDIKNLMIDFFKEFLPNTLTKNEVTDKMIEEIESGEYPVEKIVTLLKVIKNFVLDAFPPKKMIFFKKPGDNFIPWFFEIIYTERGKKYFKK